MAIASKKSYDNADSVASQINDPRCTRQHDGACRTRANLCNDPSKWLNGNGYPANKTPDLATRSSQYGNACSKYQDNVSNGDKLKTWSTVGFVVGGVAAVGTVIYYFVDPNAKEASSSEARRRRAADRARAERQPGRIPA